MAHSAGKVHNDKGGRRSALQTATPHNRSWEEEIIPGCLTAAQWTEMLAGEEVEEIAWDIMADLVGQIMDACFRVFIQSQVASFTSSWAKSYFVQNLGQQFLCRDDGDRPEEAHQTEEPEPVPANPDAWAQGCFPVVHSSSPTSQQKEADIYQASGPTQLRTSRQYKDATPASSLGGFSEGETGSGDVSRDVSDYRTPAKARKKRDCIPPKALARKVLPPLSVSPQSTEIVPPKKERRFLPKLNRSCFPRHWVTPQFEILNDSLKRNVKRPNGQPKQAPRHKRQQVERAASLRPLTSYKDHPAKDQMRKEADFWLKKSFPAKPSKAHIVSFGPLRLENVKVTSGVPLLHRRVLEMNTIQFKPHGHSARLMPIQSEASARRLQSAHLF